MLINYEIERDSMIYYVRFVLWIMCNLKITQYGHLIRVLEV
jgi:hypothetical protein